MLLSEILVTKLYVFVSSVQNNKMIVILLTYIITAILYTIIFYVVAYIKILPIKTSIFIGISTYIVGLVITTINIGFIYYLIKSKKVMK